MIDFYQNIYFNIDHNNNEMKSITTKFFNSQQISENDFLKVIASISSSNSPTTNFQKSVSNTNNNTNATGLKTSSLFDSAYDNLSIINKYTNKIAMITEKFSKNALAPFNLFFDSMNNIYDECLVEYRNLINSSTQAKRNLDKLKSSYFEAIMKQEELKRIIENKEDNSFKGCHKNTYKHYYLRKQSSGRNSISFNDNDEDALANDLYLKLNSQVQILSEHLKYEVFKYNSVCDKNEKIYNEIINKVRNNEESRMSFTQTQETKFAKLFLNIGEMFTELGKELENKSNKSLLEIRKRKSTLNMGDSMISNISNEDRLIKKRSSINNDTSPTKNEKNEKIEKGSEFGMISQNSKYECCEIKTYNNDEKEKPRESLNKEITTPIENSIIEKFKFIDFEKEDLSSIFNQSKLLVIQLNKREQLNKELKEESEQMLSEPNITYNNSLRDKNKNRSKNSSLDFSQTTTTKAEINSTSNQIKSISFNNNNHLISEVTTINKNNKSNNNNNINLDNKNNIQVINNPYSKSHYLKLKDGKFDIKDYFTNHVQNKPNQYDFFSYPDSKSRNIEEDKIFFNEDEQILLIEKFWASISQEKEADWNLVRDTIRLFTLDVKKSRILFDLILGDKKFLYVCLANKNNLQHLANVFNTISVLIFLNEIKSEEELIFAVIYIAERIYYEGNISNSRIDLSVDSLNDAKNNNNNTSNNSSSNKINRKIYLCFLISQNCTYQNRVFWKQLFDIKFCSKLEEQLKKIYPKLVELSYKNTYKYINNNNNNSNIDIPISEYDNLSGKKLNNEDTISDKDGAKNNNGKTKTIIGKLKNFFSNKKESNNKEAPIYNNNINISPKNNNLMTSSNKNIAINSVADESQQISFDKSSTQLYSAIANNIKEQQTACNSNSSTNNNNPVTLRSNIIHKSSQTFDANHFAGFINNDSLSTQAFNRRLSKLDQDMISQIKKQDEYFSENLAYILESPNYLEYQLIEKTKLEEASKIIKSFINYFANFNYDISEAIDFVVQICTDLNFPNERLSLFVTLINTSTYSIRNKYHINGLIKNSMLRNMLKNIDMKIFAISSARKYLTKKEFLNVITINKNFASKLISDFYYDELSLNCSVEECKKMMYYDDNTENHESNDINTDVISDNEHKDLTCYDTSASYERIKNKRLVIWQHILKVNEMKKLVSYSELLEKVGIINKDPSLNNSRQVLENSNKNNTQEKQETESQVKINIEIGSHMKEIIEHGETSVKYKDNNNNHHIHDAQEQNDNSLISGENHIFTKAICSSNTTHKKEERILELEQILDNFNIINLDVARTYFKTNSSVNRKKVENILKAFVIHQNNKCYCQGMNYIVSFIILITKDEVQAFYLFLCLYENTDFSSLFSEDLAKLRQFFYIFDRLLILYTPELNSYFFHNNIGSSYYCSPWFMTLFTNCYNVSDDEMSLVLLRIWDEFLINGWKAMLKTGIVLLMTYEDVILNLKYDEMLNFLFNEVLRRGFFSNENYFKFLETWGKINFPMELLNNLENEYNQDVKVMEISEKLDKMFL